MRVMRKKGTWRTECSIKWIASMMSVSHVTWERSMKRPRNWRRTRMPTVLMKVLVRGGLEVLVMVGEAYWYGYEDSDCYAC
jgi:hypothetical protein